VALAFEAGGDPAGCARTLAVLREAGAAATIFLDGRWAEANPDLVKIMAADGHELGNHAYSHPDLTRLDDDEIARELSRTEEVALRLTGRSTKPWFRPPFQRFDDRVRRIAARGGFRCLSRDALDGGSYPGPSTPEAILRRSVEQIAGGAVLTYHLHNLDTARVLPDIIAHLRSAGVRPVTVSQLPVPPKERLPRRDAPAHARTDGAHSLLELFTAELRLCAVHRGEVVTIHADEQSRPAYAAAAAAAGIALGASVQEIRGETADADEALEQAWEGSDLIIDLRSGAGLGATRLASEALRAGRRVLLVSEPEDVLRHLFPDPEVVARTREAGRRLDGAGRVEVTSEGGTALRLSKRGRPGIDQHGYSEESGRWDRWPSSRVVCAVEEESAEGRLVISKGDLLYSLGGYAERPIALTFRRGRLTKVDGEGPDAMEVREWMARAPDDGALVLAGFSWGTDPRARWERMGDRAAEPGGGIEAASREGAVMVIFGDTTSPMLGGRNTTSARFAIALRDHTVRLDGEAAVRPQRAQRADGRH